MSVFQGLILGIVQGIAEFLPISSSAHLILIPWLLGWDDGGLTFDVALHAGTLVALLVYFRKEWILLFKGLLKVKIPYLLSPNLAPDLDSRMALYIIYGTIPGAIMGLLLEKKAEHMFRAPALIATALAFMGVVLWLADKGSKKTKSLDQMTLKDSLLIGLAQGFAI
jgi:undecaprenyl-diphosphatase